MGVRLLKLIGVLALLVALLFVSLPFLLPEFIAKNKSALESLLSESLGAELRFGNAEIELFPIPEVRITEARIFKKMTGAIGEMLADAPSLRLQNNVMPLLMGKLELRQFTLEQGTLEARSPKGQPLWAVHNISFSGAMERAAQHLSILGIRAEYSNLTFDVQELSYVGDTQLLQINGARAGVKRGSLALQGSVDLGTLKTFAQIDAEGITIAEFLRTLSSFLPKDLPKGLDGLA